jgi:hypothetical protein
MDSLPVEIFDTIVSFLSMKDLKLLAATSNFWRNLIVSRIARLKPVDLINSPTLTKFEIISNAHFRMSCVPPRIPISLLQNALLNPNDDFNIKILANFHKSIFEYGFCLLWQNPEKMDNNWVQDAHNETSHLLKPSSELEKKFPMNFSVWCFVNIVNIRIRYMGLALLTTKK